MNRKNKSPCSPPKCAFCSKVADDYHYFIEPKPDTDPTLIHRLFDTRVLPVSIYHYCGHYTIYSDRPIEVTP